MYVNNVNIYKNNNQIVLPQRKILNNQAYQSKAPVETPTFCGHFNFSKLVRTFKLSPIYHFKDFSIEEYNLLTPQEIKILRRKYRLNKILNYNFYDEAEKYHSYAAESAKKNFDERFGEGNYKVIVVGRSLSSIGKVLGYKIGEKNVTQLPMSCSERYIQDENLRILISDGTMDSFDNFMYRIGLSIEEIEQNSDKHYIFIDYMDTGISMKGFRKLLHVIWGKRPENVHFEDITMGLEDLPNCKSLREYYLNDMQFKDYALVSRAEDLYQSLYSKRDMFFAPRDVKLFWFKLLDNEMIAKQKNAASLSGIG